MILKDDETLSPEVIDRRKDTMSKLDKKGTLKLKFDGEYYVDKILILNNFYTNSYTQSFL